MQLQQIRPVLYTTQLIESIDFYTSVLHFNLVQYREDWGWAHVSKDQVSLMLTLPNAHLPFNGPVFTGSIYIDTNQVEKLYEQLKGKVSLVYPLEEFDYGMREFAIMDNNGYVLQFGQER